MPTYKYHSVFRGLYFILTGLIVIAPALYNRYPLMYFDSGAYMEMAVNLEPSFHRSIGYPFLMKITGWQISNWPIVFIQGLLCSFLIYRLMKAALNINDRQRFYWYHFAAVTLMSFGSAMSWYAAQLMPDIWTLILVFSVASVVITKKLSLKWAAVYGSLIFLGLLTHLSHVPLLLLICIPLALLHIPSIGASSSLNKSQWIVLLVPLVLAFFTLSGYNAYHKHGFRMSMASNVFITANLSEMGILKLYLDENCHEIQTSLCDMKDELPKETGGFLWSAESPVVKNNNDWVGLNEEYAPIVHAFLTNPRYLKWLAFASVKATLKQMFQIELGSGLQYAYGEGSAPYWPMKSHYQQELNEYLVSVQNKGDQLPIEPFRIINYLTMLISVLIIARAILLRQLSTEIGILLMVFVLAYFFNAAITGILANVYERLQVRLLPVLQFLAILVYLNEVDSRKRATEG